jgi:hypothetical protein
VDWFLVADWEPILFTNAGISIVGGILIGWGILLTITIKSCSVIKPDVVFDTWNRTVDTRKPIAPYGCRSVHGRPSNDLRLNKRIIVVPSGMQ